jgi:hypothetical protein
MRHVADVSATGSFVQHDPPIASARCGRCRLRQQFEREITVGHYQANVDHGQSKGVET